jgi:hypothetical protein
MTDDPVDFEAFKDRRILAEIDADEAHWWAVVDQLVAVLMKSELSDVGITSAALRALLDVLQAGGVMSRVEAIGRVADSLDTFRTFADLK